MFRNLFKSCSQLPTRPIRVTPNIRSRLALYSMYSTLMKASTENGLGITDKAIKQLQQIQEREQDSEQMLRILVDSGGCHGFQNKLELTQEIEEDDVVFEKEGVKVIIDNISLQYLRGSTLDYVQELIGSTFQVIENPNAKHSCGCNISYDIDLDKIQQ